MATNMQESILQAIDTIVNNRIENYPADKTILGTIVSCTNALTNEYRVNYAGGTIVAYAQQGTSYVAGTTVYILVPQGNFNGEKQIISAASATGDDNNISYISSTMNDYNITSAVNPISLRNGKEYPVQLYSYRAQDLVLIYDRNNKEASLVGIDEQQLEYSLKEAEALMIETSFFTRLPREHRFTTTGTYGISFSLAFRDLSKITSDTPIKDIKEDQIKYFQYTIDINDMMGNPFNFTSYSDQFAIFPIDIKNFLWIDNILAFSKDFVEVTDEKMVQLHGSDIKIKDLEIYGLRKIGAVDGDYRLKLSFPQGNLLKSFTTNEKLSAVGQFLYLDNDLSTQAMYSWFIEDSRIKSSNDKGFDWSAGIGWRLIAQSSDENKSKNNSYIYWTSGYDNRAYENKYMCIVKYQELIVLKDQFTVYNEAAKRNLDIFSKYGLNYQFDNSNAELYCRIDEKTVSFSDDPKDPDSNYDFIWSKVDSYGTTYIFDKTKEELEEELEELLNTDFEPSDVTYYKNQIAALEGVSFNGNELIYPLKGVDSRATFKCGVYHKDTSDGSWYHIGTPEITLENDNAVQPSDYYIKIQNGDQVFQYNEDGTSPTLNSNQYPLTILPLFCHFYSPQGVEIDSNTYSLSWEVPVNNTLIKINKKGASLNAATGEMNIYQTDELSFELEDMFDYSKYNNQIICIVKYGNQTWRQPTNLLFTKVGNNGTNGTDIVTRMIPQKENNGNKPLTMILNNGKFSNWSNGGNSSSILKANLYNQNMIITGGADNTKFENSGLKNRSQYLKISGNGNSCSIVWDTSETSTNKNQRNYIVKSTTTYNSKKIYAFYPICIIDKISNEIDVNHIYIDKNRMLESVIYAADGYFPLYNENNNLHVELDSKYGIEWKAEGGMDSPAFKFKSQTCTYDDSTQSFRLTDSSVSTIVCDNITNITVIPNEFFDGLCDNNIIHGYLKSKTTGRRLDLSTYINTLKNSKKIEQENVANQLQNLQNNYTTMTGDEVIKKGQSLVKAIAALITMPDANKLDMAGKIGNTIKNYINSKPTLGSTIYAHIYIPIHFGLNTYGLKSLNDWDGVSLEINENENYIMAPQIGAGVKEESNGANRFTGIVMGKLSTFAETTDNKRKIGLQGFSNGEQSIFLDAEDGSATFGLPGTTTGINGMAQTAAEGQIKLIPYGTSKIGKWMIGQDFLMGSSVVPADSRNQLDLTEYSEAARATTVTPAGLLTYRNKRKVAFPAKVSGILMQAGDNPYLSVQGPVLDDSFKVDTNNIDAHIHNGDSLEVELNPNTGSVFGIYQHKKDDLDKGSNSRTQIAGIDALGRFVSNIVKDTSTQVGAAMAMSNLGAFGKTSNDGVYYGLKTEVGTNVLFKIFSTDFGSNSSANMFITGSKSATDEYTRPISIHGKLVALYATPNGSASKINITTPNKITISNSGFYGGTKDQNSKEFGISIPTSGTAYINAHSGLDILINNNNLKTADAAGYGPLNIYNSNFMNQSKGTVTIKAGANLFGTNQPTTLSMTTTNIDETAQRFNLVTNNLKISSHLDALNNEASGTILRSIGNTDIWDDDSNTNYAQSYIFIPNGNSQMDISNEGSTLVRSGSSLNLYSKSSNVLIRSNFGEKANGASLTLSSDGSWSLASLNANYPAISGYSGGQCQVTGKFVVTSTTNLKDETTVDKTLWAKNFYWKDDAARTYYERLYGDKKTYPVAADNRNLKNHFIAIDGSFTGVANDISYLNTSLSNSIQNFKNIYNSHTHTASGTGVTSVNFQLPASTTTKTFSTTSSGSFQTIPLSNIVISGTYVPAGDVTGNPRSFTNLQQLVNNLKGTVNGSISFADSGGISNGVNVTVSVPANTFSGSKNNVPYSFRVTSSGPNKTA